MIATAEFLADGLSPSLILDKFLNKGRIDFVSWNLVAESLKVHSKKVNEA